MVPPAHHAAGRERGKKKAGLRAVSATKKGAQSCTKPDLLSRKKEGDSCEAERDEEKKVGFMAKEGEGLVVKREKREGKKTSLPSRSRRGRKKEKCRATPRVRGKEIVVLAEWTGPVFDREKKENPRLRKGRAWASIEQSIQRRP